MDVIVRVPELHFFNNLTSTSKVFFMGNRSLIMAWVWVGEVATGIRKKKSDLP